MDYCFSQKNLHCAVTVVTLSSHARKMNMWHDGEASVTILHLIEALQGHDYSNSRSSSFNPWEEVSSSN
jgi:hypothetical protein